MKCISGISLWHSKFSILQYKAKTLFQSLYNFTQSVKLNCRQSQLFACHIIIDLSSVVSGSLHSSAHT